MQSFLAKYNNKLVGIGDCASYSFKTQNTYGEGGVIITNDTDFANKLKSSILYANVSAKSESN